jgi:hypothetical protein
MAQHAAQQPTRDPAPPGERVPHETVVVHGSDISVDRAHSELPRAEARSRFGGVDVPAVIGGALAGLGAALVLGGIASAIGLTIGQGDAETLALAALAVALVLIALSALTAGWVAGRAARFDGARNGLLAGLLMALLLALMGAAGAYSATETSLPVSLDSDRLTTAALVAAAAALLVSLLLGLLGGRLGARWHRDVDDVIVGTRPGAVGTPVAVLGPDAQTGR